jgi:hypothetical protein
MKTILPFLIISRAKTAVRQLCVAKLNKSKKLIEHLNQLVDLEPALAQKISKKYTANRYF